MFAIDLVVIGGSAGGLPALFELLRGLPHDLPAAICVAFHTSPYSPGKLADIVERKTRLASLYAEDGQKITAGLIYFAPVDRHLLIDDGYLRVTRGPRENGFRPAVDPLFRTAARCYGPRAAGVVLSGSLGDGSNGLAAIKQAGGIAIVQDPDEAMVPSMPLSALRSVEVDHIVKAADMSSLIQRLAGSRTKGTAAMPNDTPSVTDPAERGTALATQTPQGELTPLTCPECGGSLWEQQGGGPISFRCHVGHVYNGESMLQYHSQKVEAALWSALRVLEEHASLQERMAARADARQYLATGQQFHRRASDYRQQAEMLRNVLLASPAATFPAEQSDFETSDPTSRKVPEDAQ